MNREHRGRRAAHGRTRHANRASDAEAPGRSARAPGAETDAEAPRHGPTTALGHPRDRAGRAVPVPWAILGALGLLPLLWSGRTPTLGVPVADDYLFLSRLAFERPLDLFGPMGAANYWRPVSRQLYYLVLGPALLRAPWVAALFAALLLLALYAVLYRLARRGFAPPLAAAIACFPLLSAPARVLLDWPSAAQHLLGALFAAWAIERAVAGRLVVSSLAALLAVLSNEAAFLVLPALPLIGWARTRTRNGALRWAAGALVVGALWAAGYAVARTHGAGLPHGAGHGAPWRAAAPIILQSLVSQLGMEDLSATLGPLVVPVFGLLAAVGVVFSLARPARERIRRAGPTLIGGVAWFAIGVLPLVFVLPDWNAWRTTVASLGLGFALTGWLGLARPALAGALVALRLLALLLTIPAPATVESTPPDTVSSFSLARLVRLQRIVESTRRTLTRAVPTLKRGAVVRYWQMPLLSEVGFNGNHAIQVWYRDSALTLRPFGEASGMSQGADVVIEIENGWAWPAVRISPEAVRFYRESYRASMAQDLRAADSLLGLAQLAQRENAPRFVGNIAENRAEFALRLHAYARADSFNRMEYELIGESAHYWAMTARLAAQRGNLDAARSAVSRCLALDPHDPAGRAIASILKITP
ncbi:MAG TPA: hypothetical protein VMS88_02400 [Terriglobales bacterium]|nr:hypothetical protein [Terriglobales bacterium]